MTSVLFVLEKWLSWRPTFVGNLLKEVIKSDVAACLLSDKLPTNVACPSYKTFIPSVNVNYVLSLKGVLYRFVFMICLFPTILWIVKKNKIDIIHTNIPICCIPSFLAAKLLKKKVVLSVTAFAGKRWFHMNKSRLKAHILYLLETTCLRLPYDRIVPLGSNFLKEIKELDIDPKSIVYLTPTTVDLSLFNPTVDGLRFRKKHEINETDIVVLFVSTIDRTKGVFHLLEAFKEFHEIHPSSKLVFVGPGRDLPSLKKAVMQLKLDDSVILTGKIDHSEMPEVMASADIYVRPGFTEGMPMAVIEALACGKAVIAADVGGTSEIIVHGKTGLLINPKDIKTIVRFLVELSKNVDLRLNLGRTGRKLIETKYTLEKMTQEYIALYKDLSLNC